MHWMNTIRKYIDYVFEARPFVYRSDAGIATAEGAARRATELPAIFINGIMPRAGTVYVGELLRLHPDLHAFPRQLWELPLLQLSDDALKMQRAFLRIYEQNTDKMGASDFLGIVGAGMLHYLQAETPPGKRMLIKVPSVQYLHYFPAMYPGQHLLLLVRDGRDVAHSTVKTWPQILFPFACRRWRRAAEMVTAYHDDHKHQTFGYWLARFEDAVGDPEGFVREACRRFDLDVTRYPFEQIATIRVRGSSQLKPQGKVTWDPKDRPPNFAPTGHWRDWSRYRKQTFKRIAGRALIALDYCEDLQW